VAVQRLDNVLVVVEDLERSIAFFEEVGLHLDGRMRIDDQRWAEAVIGLTGVREEIAMMRTPDGASGIELCRFDAPAAQRGEPADAPVNTLGYRRVMFAVDDVVARLRERHGATLVGEVVDYEGVYRLCFVRGPEGLIVGLAQPLAG
jgi:catechol 2,3-dioxygenase-like lactoylglutathione lyase family enzyme